nr:hypothetical protein [Candidatus Bathyarchaeota archaeon]
MMLAPEHIRVKRRKGVMTAIYASEEELGLAKAPVSGHRGALGRTPRGLGGAGCGARGVGR